VADVTKPKVILNCGKVKFPQQGKQVLQTRFTYYNTTAFIYS